MQPGTTEKWAAPDRNCPVVRFHPPHPEKARKSSPLAAEFCRPGRRSSLPRISLLSALCPRILELEVIGELTSIADLKVSQIDRWRKERLRDASRPRSKSMLPDLVRRSPPSGRPGRPTAPSNLVGKIQAGSEYDQIHVLDRLGKAGFSVPDEIPRLLGRRPPPPGPFPIGTPGNPGFLQGRDESRAFLSLLIPVTYESPQPAVVGVLALRIDPEIYLYPFIQQWPRPSQTAETLIVRRDGDDVLFLNELRFQKNTALNLRVPIREKTIAGQAVEGREGIVKGLDYRRKTGDRKLAPDPGLALVPDRPHRRERSERPVARTLMDELRNDGGSSYSPPPRTDSPPTETENPVSARTVGRGTKHLRAVSSRQEALIASLPEIIMEVDQRQESTSGPTSRAWISSART